MTIQRGRPPLRLRDETRPSFFCTLVAQDREENTHISKDANEVVNESRLAFLLPSQISASRANSLMYNKAASILQLLVIRMTISVF